MPRKSLTPQQRLRLQHRYDDLAPGETYVIMSTFGDHVMESQPSDAAETRELLELLLTTAEADQRTPTREKLPILALDAVYRLDEVGEYALVGSAWDAWAQCCLDCGVNTCLVLHEYYMVTDAIWAQVVPEGSNGGMLCVGCLESRLGRQLTRVDFADVPLNSGADWLRSERLQARLATPGELSPIR